MDFSYLGVAALAGLVGVVEVLSRYRDVPVIVLREWPAWTYIGTNAVAGVLALVVIDTLGWPLADELPSGVQRGAQIGAAAFGALAVMRTAVIQIRVDDRDVHVGPHWFLNALLGFTANRMSIRRARHVQEITTKIMSKVDFDQAKLQLPSLCFSLMRTPQEVQKDVSREITSFDVSTMANKTKSLQLGLVLLDLVGEDVLSQAVETLSDEISLSESDGSARTDSAAGS